MGITFKENCPDIRNSRVIDIIKELMSYKLIVDVYDPWALYEDVKKEYGIDLITDLGSIKAKYDSIIIAVSHNEFLEIDLNKILNAPNVIFDVKGILPKEQSDLRL